MEAIHDNHCVHQLGLHLIWCTKYRHKVLVGMVEIEVKRIIAETCSIYGWIVHSVEVMPDHVHLFTQINPSVTPLQVASTLKSITAIQVFTLFPQLKGKKFWGSGLWSKSTYYGAVGQVNDEIIKKYIDGQKDES